MIPPKHKKALKELYTKNGVGKLVEQRLAYWESTVPGGYSISHSPPDWVKVAIFEQCWLVDHYPKDFKFC